MVILKKISGISLYVLLLIISIVYIFILSNPSDTLAQSHPKQKHFSFSSETSENYSNLQETTPNGAENSMSLQENSPATENNAPLSDVSSVPVSTLPLHVYFNFFDSSSNDIDQTIGLYSMEVTGTIKDTYIEAAINPAPGMFDFEEIEGFPQVLLNYGDVSGRERNITEECTYHAKDGTIHIPVCYANEYLTVKCIMSEQSTAYQRLIPNAYKIIKNQKPMLRAPATDTSEFEVIENSCNDIFLVGDTSKYNSGDVISVSNAYIQTLNKREDPLLYNQTGTTEYMGYKGEAIGYAISFDCSSDPLFSNLGHQGGSAIGEFPVSYDTYTSFSYHARNWIYARCITTDSNYFSGNPKFSGGKLYITDKAADGTLTCWIELYLTGPKNENAQNVGMYFKVHPINLQTLTITKKELLSTKSLSGAKFSLWSYDGSSYNQRLGYFKDNENGTYTFSDINVNASVEQRFLIKEEIAPKGYALPYYQSNKNDKEDYSTYGGRTIQFKDGTWTSSFSSFLTFYDKPRTRANLTINKTIYKEDVYWSHGYPTFFFKIYGFDLDGKVHTWHRCVSYTPRYVNENTNADGTITLSASLTDIPRGNYIISELPVSRFTLTNVTAQTGNVYIGLTPKEKSYEGIKPVSAVVRANLSEEDAEITFFNRKITWEKYNHNHVIINEFPLELT